MSTTTSEKVVLITAKNEPEIFPRNSIRGFLSNAKGYLLLGHDADGNQAVYELDLPPYDSSAKDLADDEEFGRIKMYLDARIANRVADEAEAAKEIYDLVLAGHPTRYKFRRPPMSAAEQIL